MPYFDSSAYRSYYLCCLVAFVGNTLVADGLTFEEDKSKAKVDVVVVLSASCYQLASRYSS